MTSRLKIAALGGIGLVPASGLDEPTVLQRFGAPAEFARPRAPSRR